MHIQRRRIMDKRILRGYVSYIFRRLVVTTRDKCGFRRDLRIYIYCIVILNFCINRSAPFIQRVVKNVVCQLQVVKFKLLASG